MDDTRSGTSTCIGDILMSETNFDDAPIDFTELRWLGLDNPVRLNGLTTAWQVAMEWAHSVLALPACISTLL